MVKLIGRTGIRGFTLLEIIIVIAIVAILAGAMIPVFRGRSEDARITKAKSEIEALASAIFKLRVDTARWPGSDVPWNLCGACVKFGGGDLKTLEEWNDPGAGLINTNGYFNNWQGSYIAYVTADPWGTPYYYDGYPGRAGDSGLGESSICSWGPNKTDDSSRDRADRTAQGDDICKYLN